MSAWQLHDGEYAIVGEFDGVIDGVSEPDREKEDVVVGVAEGVAEPLREPAGDGVSDADAVGEPVALNGALTTSLKSVHAGIVAL